MPWCSGYQYCTTSFDQVLCWFKSCLLRVRDLWWWGSLTMVPAGNKPKYLLSINHTIKTIHHHHHHQRIPIGFFLPVTQYTSLDTPSTAKISNLQLKLHELWIEVMAMVSFISEQFLFIKQNQTLVNEPSINDNENNCELKWIIVNL